ncbi:phosphate ABC transporter permease subunit PstC [Eionea flava]
MTLSMLFLVVVIGTLVTFYICRQRSLAIAKNLGGIRHLHSLPVFYGIQSALWCVIPCLLIFGLWVIFDDIVIRQLVMQHLTLEQQALPANELQLLLSAVESIGSGTSSINDPQLIAISVRIEELRHTSRMALTVAILCILIGLSFLAFSKLKPEIQARTNVERAFMLFLLLCSTLAIFTTVGIVFSVLFESIRFFQIVPPAEFLFTTQWSPQLSIRADQVGSSGAFGAVPLFTGTLLISAIAMLVAVPSGLMTAIYLSEYANKRVRATVKPILEILAGIPTVVYGFFAALTIAPMIKNLLHGLGLDIAFLGVSIGPLAVSGESALAAGLVMGVMIIPFVSSLSDDVINAVPQSLRDGAYGLGSTQSETIKKVIFPAALPGIVGAILLAISRAIGETMIVVMAVGTAAKLTANPLESVTTVTVQMTTLLIGDHEFDSAKTLAAFALGLVLFIITLGLNFLALNIVKKYREQYD